MNNKPEPTDMLTVACVLKSGGPYTERDVIRLHEAVYRHLPEPHKFVCLTDRPNIEGVRCIPLKENWPGWWAKICLFAESTFEAGERVLYLDLDSLVLGDLSPLANFAGKGPNGRLIVLRDFYHPMHYGSGVMAFRGGELAEIYETFKKTASAYIRQSGPFWGDQQVIEACWPGALMWQDLCPGRIVSYKVDCAKQGKPQEGAALVAFHGAPRPWQVLAPWVREYWEGVTV